MLPKMVSGKAAGRLRPRGVLLVGTPRGDEGLRTKPEGIFSSLKRGWALCNKTL